MARLPIADERPLRNVGICHAPDCQREHGEERQLPANQADLAGAMVLHCHLTTYQVHS